MKPKETIGVAKENPVVVGIVAIVWGLGVTVVIGMGMCFYDMGKRHEVPEQGVAQRSLATPMPGLPQPKVTSYWEDKIDIVIAAGTKDDPGMSDWILGRESTYFWYDTNGRQLLADEIYPDGSSYTDVPTWKSSKEVTGKAQSAARVVLKNPYPEPAKVRIFWRSEKKLTAKRTAPYQKKLEAKLTASSPEGRGASVETERVTSPEPAMDEASWKGRVIRFVEKGSNDATKWGHALEIAGENGSKFVGCRMATVYLNEREISCKKVLPGDTVIVREPKGHSLVKFSRVTIVARANS